MNIFKNWFAQRAVEKVDYSGTQPPPQYKATVLVVDDSRTVLISLNKMLLQLGFKCVTATAAREGIELAKTLKPNLILMDVVMPEINGFQATRLLRNIPETSSIPIIIISGTQLGTDQFWGQKMGANGFLPKPINKLDFLELAGQLLNAREAATG
jgi:twitching motility two-component system response regulator PilH